MKLNHFFASRPRAVLLSLSLLAVILSGCGDSGKSAAAGSNASSPSRPNTEGSSAPFSTTRNGIDGTWGLPEMEVNGIRFASTLSFTNDTITLSNVCTFADGSTVPAEVVTRIENTVEVLQARASVNNSDGSHTCRASVDVKAMKYSIRGGTMTATSEGEQGVLTLQRSQGTTGNGLVGVWKMDPVYQNGIRFNMSLEFTDGTMTLSNQCVFPDGVTLPVSVTTNTKTSFKILEAKSYDNTEDPTRSCNASIDVGTLAYVVNGTTLTLSMPNTPGPIQLNRR